MKLGCDLQACVWCGIAACFVLAASGARAADEPAPNGRVFRAGAATSNITPALGVSLNGGMTDRKATHVHDELLARCLVLDDGTTRIAIAVCDSCMIPREVADAAKRLIEQRTKIPASHVLISATHTHTAPTATPVFQSEPDPEYLKFMTVRIADGVQRAANLLTPATAAWGVGQCPQHVFNRRWRMKPGTIPPDPFGRSTDRVQMNPPVSSENLLEPAGPTDPDVCVLYLDRPLSETESSPPIAMLANYALHYVGGAPGDHVSADYFGAFARQVEADGLSEPGRDPPFVALLANGASADVNNINFRVRPLPSPPFERQELVAEHVAVAAFDAVPQTRHHDFTVAAATTTLKLGVRKPTAEEVKRAEEIVAKAAGRELRSLPEIYAGETLAMKDYPDDVELVLQVVRIGDTVICAIPCEVFVEIGLELKQRSPFRHTVIFSLANGYNGYLPTPAHHELGGYETWRAKSSYLEVGASPKIVAKLVELMDAVK